MLGWDCWWAPGLGTSEPPSSGLLGCLAGALLGWMAADLAACLLPYGAWVGWACGLPLCPGMGLESGMTLGPCGLGGLGCWLGLVAACSGGMPACSWSGALHG